MSNVHDAAERPVKRPWEAPVVSRLDVEQTAGGLSGLTENNPTQSNRRLLS